VEDKINHSEDIRELNENSINVSSLFHILPLTPKEIINILCQAPNISIVMKPPAGQQESLLSPEWIKKNKELHLYGTQVNIDLTERFLCRQQKIPKLLQDLYTNFHCDTSIQIPKGFEYCNNLRKMKLSSPQPPPEHIPDVVNHKSRERTTNELLAMFKPTT